MIFSFGRLAAANMAFLLVAVENGFYLVIKCFVGLFKFCGDVLMDGAFADSELTRRCSDRCVVLNDISPQNDASFLVAVGTLLQDSPPLQWLVTVNMYVIRRQNMIADKLSKKMYLDKSHKKLYN